MNTDNTVKFYGLLTKREDNFLKYTYPMYDKIGNFSISSGNDQKMLYKEGGRVLYA